ncbi:protein SPT2 homolog [Anopheles nili]|uniref:protein SPT2 homolog n=1 Tax=Anopheles nili TaxID=185578 RepID=UPI00237C1E82|nr:protein SPT2 homolog [Anopheles nili]
MDFGKLLNVAKRNTSTVGLNGEGRYYSTKFAPPKKENKEKKLSENIKKFLAKKEEEDRLKKLETRRKAEELMAKRDVKAKKKIEKMLKVIKSANKSVLDDAINTQDNTILSAEQPDADDYGYTSNVASEFYQQLMNKYKSNPEEQKFKEAKKRTMSKEDLALTKARVKDAIMKQVEEESTPRSRKSRLLAGSGGIDDRDGHAGTIRPGPDPYDPVEEQRRRANEVGAKVLKDEKKKAQGRKACGPPPPPDFATLLKLAEQKQFEPIKIEIPIEKRREPERLMTKREKKEHDERMAFLEMKRLRDRIKQDPKLSEKEKQNKLLRLETLRASNASNYKRMSTPLANSIGGNSLPGKSTSTNDVTSAKPVLSANICGRTTSSSSVASKSVETPNKISKRSDPSSSDSAKRNSIGIDSLAAANQSSLSVQGSKAKTVSSISKTSNVTSIDNKSSSPSIKPASSAQLSSVSQSQRSKTSASINGLVSSALKPSSNSLSSSSLGNGKLNAVNMLPSRSSTVGGRMKGTTETVVLKNEIRPSTVAAKQRPLAVVQTRHFSPSDVQRPLKRPAQTARASSAQRLLNTSNTISSKKRRVIDSDSEYDSEMDDFIDDGDCDEDYSSAIKEIFGYDKSRFRDERFDDEDYNMESSYAQQMHEEYISKKIGIMEDLEDMRMEEEEKRRKLVNKKALVKKK